MTEQSPNARVRIARSMQGANLDGTGQFLARYHPKSSSGCIAGLSAFAGHPMEPADAMAAGSIEDAENKIEAIKRAGVIMAGSPTGLGKAVLAAI